MCACTRVLPNVPSTYQTIVLSATTSTHYRYPYVLYLLLEELSGDVLLAAIIYPCQLFLVGFNCLLLYMTWPFPRHSNTARAADISKQQQQQGKHHSASREGPLAGVGKRVREATQAGVFHPDGRVRVGMAPRVLH